jgi:signal transduction histidine kinase
MAALIALSLCGIVFSARLVFAREEELRELELRAVADERRRFARDLHDLLGLSLSAITLKGELVDRLVVQQPERAKAELEEMLTMSRKALADVRASRRTIGSFPSKTNAASPPRCCVPPEWKSASTGRRRPCHRRWRS